jgi:hypothetical protein
MRSNFAFREFVNPVYLGFSMKNREQLASTARSHEIVHLFLRRGEVIESLHVDHYHGE